MSEGSNLRAELLIRSPSVDTPANFSIHASMEQTISEVKAAIEREHSLSPSSRDMRIIWKGRILQDTICVRGICEDESTGERCLQQTLHFVLGIPMSPRSPIQQQQQKRTTPLPATQSALETATSSAASTEGTHMRRGATAALPTVVPLGNQFQYVLVDGVPHLMELRSRVPTRGGDLRHLAPAPSVNHYGTATTTHEMRATSPGHPPGSAGARAFSQLYDRAMARAREAGLHSGGLRPGAEVQDARATETAGGAAAGIGAAAAPAPADAAEVRRREGVNAVPLADLLRGFGFSTVWSFFLMVLRVLLLVVVLAHDASMDRLFALVCVIAIVAALRSPWMHRHMQWLNDFNRDAAQPTAEQQHEPPREYSALEKARALFIALFTSLVPSEPFQIPAADA
ncbi:hypothetical protein COEREDRAFT_82322 [Coemansia reversa NRRL 1564]|uniref:Ubiquitin-like domain-containing protein n=1 Tax=Coemansia reversa (strain ATCC 12441 / NRRL 1564) TaxID=763665 RepID=A0A2G5B7W8_COERN|nr:hypothetical protein COEREDRAFT_82322 [Coemansia reversa NRRL 1564]|eukprot:PIA15126.1 hypothetical protein COEREDRAFT_82322 [Coemansia reversa NRRL 1564]